MAFTPIFWDSFETQDLERWSATNGFTNTAAQAKYGSRSGVTGVGRNYASYTLPSSETEIYLHAWIWPNSWWSGSQLSPVLAIGDGDEWFFGLGGDYGTTDVLYTLTGASTGWTTISGASWNTSAFQRVEVRLSIHASTGVCQVKIGGSQVLDFSGDTSDSGNNANITRVAAGAPFSYGGQTYIDEFVCGTTDWPGDLRIERAVPTGDGNSSDWTLSTGTDHYALVDETPPSGSDYAYTNSTGQVDLFTKAALSGTIGTVYGVGCFATMSTEGSPTPTNARMVTRISSTDYNGSDQSVGADDTIFSVWTASPATASAWTETEINNAEFGIESRA